MMWKKEPLSLSLGAVVFLGSLLAGCKSEKNDDGAAAAAYGAYLISTAACQSSAPAFSESAANQASGQTQYGSLCSACHGAAGGGGQGPALSGYASRSTFQSAAVKIHCTMPLGNSGACVHDCARDIARYIRVTF